MIKTVIHGATALLLVGVAIGAALTISIPSLLVSILLTKQGEKRRER